MDLRPPSPGRGEAAVDTLFQIRDDARSLVTRQVQGLNSLDAKANQMMTLSATMLVVIIGGLSILANGLDPSKFFQGDQLPAWAGAGLICAATVAFLVAIVGSVVAYMKTGIFVGLAPDYLKNSMIAGATLAVYFQESIEVYLEGIRQLEVENVNTARALEWTIKAFVVGVILAVLGSAALIGTVFAI